MTASGPRQRRIKRSAPRARSDPRRDDEEARVFEVAGRMRAPEQLTGSDHAEAGRTAKRTFPFSAFKRALCVVAARLQPELRAGESISCSGGRGRGGWPKRDKRDIELAPGRLRVRFESLAPCLAKVFAYYGQTPTDFEIKVLQRGAPRADVDRMQQSCLFRAGRRSSRPSILLIDWK